MWTWNAWRPCPSSARSRPSISSFLRRLDHHMQGRIAFRRGRRQYSRKARCRRSLRRVDTERRQPLAGHGIRHRVLERPRRLPLAGGADVAGGTDLIDAPVDLEVVAVGVAKLDGEL